VFTLHRHPVAQSTDAIRSRVGYERGLHVFELTWPSRERGTHAVVGVCTADAPVHCVGYQGLVGNSEHSWGWDLGRLKAFHDSKNLHGESYPEGAKPEHAFVVPDKFLRELAPHGEDAFESETLSFVLLSSGDEHGRRRRRLCRRGPLPGSRFQRSARKKALRDRVGGVGPLRNFDEVPGRTGP